MNPRPSPSVLRLAAPARCAQRTLRQFRLRGSPAQPWEDYFCWDFEWFYMELLANYMGWHRNHRNIVKFVGFIYMYHQILGIMIKNMWEIKIRNYQHILHILWHWLNHTPIVLSLLFYRQKMVVWAMDMDRMIGIYWDLCKHLGFNDQNMINKSLMYPSAWCLS